MEQVFEEIKEAQRIVIKVGTSTLTHDTGRFNLKTIDCLVRVISDLRSQGKDIVFVTSGAIGAGVGKLGWKERPKTIPERQAAAAVGQCELMHLYDKLFAEYGHIIAQILLTKDVVDNEHRKNNAINTFNTLLGLGVIPIVNENDTIAIEEIDYADNFGDNDTLSAVVSKLIEADLLIILSDIDGLYDCDPKINCNAEIIPIVNKVDKNIKTLAGGAGTDRGTGGMITKLAAAEMACNVGVNVIITKGDNPRILYDLFEGKQVGTIFLRKGQKIT